MDPGQLGTTDVCSELRNRQAEVGGILGGKDSRGGGLAVQCAALRVTGA